MPPDQFIAAVKDGDTACVGVEIDPDHAPKPVAQIPASVGA
jgi:hypothetical protein